MIKFKTKQIIDVDDWDNFVSETYGKPYNFQQQDGCKSRQTVYFSVPDYAGDFKNDSISEEVNGSEMGVSFEAWLARDPKQWTTDDKFDLQLFSARNFYPDMQVVANDLHAKGLLPAGDYGIEIDW